MLLLNNFVLRLRVLSARGFMKKYLLNIALALIDASVIFPPAISLSTRAVCHADVENAWNVDIV
jgi:hypothetical protein